MTRRRRRQVDDWDEAEIADGQGVRVSVLTLDAPAKRTTISDVMADYTALCAHRPGYAANILTANSRPALDSASDELLARTGMSLAQAVAMRDWSFRALEQGSQNAWRDAKRLEQLGAQGGDGDEEKDDPDDNNGDDLAAASAARDRAYSESVTRMSNAWRGNPNNTNTIERNRQRIQGGR
jgi:hypothetical protein